MLFLFKNFAISYLCFLLHEKILYESIFSKEEHFWIYFRTNISYNLSPWNCTRKATQNFVLTELLFLPQTSQNQNSLNLGVYCENTWDNTHYHFGQPNSYIIITASMWTGTKWTRVIGQLGEEVGPSYPAAVRGRLLPRCRTCSSRRVLL